MKFHHNRIKPKVKHKNSSKGKLLIPNFIKYLKKHYSGDCHHWYGNGRTGGRLDIFVVMINVDLHRSIHFGDIGVQGYIDEIGELNLIENSMYLLQEWIDNGGDTQYQELINDITADPDRAIEIAKAF